MKRDEADDTDPDLLRVVAAAIATHKKNKFKPKTTNNPKQPWTNPWSLPPDVWNKLTPEQKKLWVDLKEAARVRNTGSGAPPFKAQGGWARTVWWFQQAKHKKGQPDYHWQSTVEIEEEELQEEEARWILTNNHSTVMTSLSSNNASSAMSEESTIQELLTYPTQGKQWSLPSRTEPNKGNLMVDGCADTSIAILGKGFVETYTTEKKGHPSWIPLREYQIWGHNWRGSHSHRPTKWCGNHPT